MADPTLRFAGGLFLVEGDDLVARFTAPRKEGPLFRKRLVNEHRYPVSTIRELRVTDFGTQKAVRVLPPGQEVDVYYNLQPPDQIDAFCAFIKSLSGATTTGFNRTANLSPAATDNLEVEIDRGKVRVGRTLGKAAVSPLWAVMRPSLGNDKVTIKRK